MTYSEKARFSCIEARRERARAERQSAFRRDTAKMLAEMLSILVFAAFVLALAYVLDPIQARHSVLAAIIAHLF